MLGPRAAALKLDGLTPSLVTFRGPGGGLSGGAGPAIGGLAEKIASL